MNTIIIEKFFNKENGIKAVGKIIKKENTVILDLKILEEEEFATIQYYRYYKTLIEFAKLYFPKVDKIIVYVDQEEKYKKESLEVLDLGFLHDDSKGQREYYKNIKKEDKVSFRIHEGAIYVENRQVGFYMIHGVNKRKLLHIDLEERTCNKTFMIDLYKVLSDMCLMNPKLDKIYLYVNPYNYLEKEVISKAGFMEEEQHYEEDVIQYSKKLERRIKNV